MPPPVMQRGMPNMGAMGPMQPGPSPQQGMNVMGGPGGSNSLLQLEQWGQPRYPNNGPNQQVLRPNQNQLMQQQVKYHKIYLLFLRFINLKFYL